MNKSEFLEKYIPEYNYIISIYEDYKLYLDFEDGIFELPDNIHNFNITLETIFVGIFKNIY